MARMACLRSSLFLLLVAAIGLSPTFVDARESSPTVFGGEVRDALGRPIADVSVRLETKAGGVIAHTITDARGSFHFNAAAIGALILIASKSGFATGSLVVELPRSEKSALLITLATKRPLVVPVRAALLAQNGISPSGTNRYSMSAADINQLPQGEATPLNQVMLQMPGVALDQNQEIHIRGEHMGIQYQLNGIMLPLDMNTDPTFTQLLNSRFVDSVSLLDGVLPARFGYRTSGVIDIHTKSGCDGGHNAATLMGGQRDTAQGSFQIGGCEGNFEYFATGTFTQSNLGFSSAVRAPDPIHDAVTQGQGFSTLAYSLNPTTKISLLSGMTLAFNQFPNQPNEIPEYQLEGVNPAAHPSSTIDSGLNQQDYFGVVALNSAINASWEYQVAYSAHYNTQSFYPDPIGDLIYQGVASNVFTSDLSNTLQTDVTHRVGSHVMRGGTYLGEYGVESDQTSRVFPLSNGVPSASPISVTANLNKINLVYGFYFEDTWAITKRLSLNFGSRWDRVTGFTFDSQFSPTINATYKASDSITLHGGFARNFQIPNFQGIPANISQLFQNTSGAVGSPSAGAPHAETDYTWDAGFIYRISPRLTFAQDNYFRVDRHYLDEGEFGFVPIDAPFNYVRGYGGGIENSLTYNIENFTTRWNLYFAREEDIGVASGQYNFPPDELAYIDRHYIVLDHTPLIGASGGAAYRWRNYLFSFDGLFSSGLRSGFANQNQLPKVWQFNLSAARDFSIPPFGRFTNRIVLLNIFDRTNLIRPSDGIGVFQAAYGPRVTVYDALTIPLPSL